MSDQPVEQTVSELLRIARELLADERARGQALDTKTATLAGFTGTILALSAAVGRDLFDVELGRVGDPLARALFLLTVAALAAGAILAVTGVLRPQEQLAIAPEEIQHMGEFPLIASPKMDVEGRMLNTTTVALLRERNLNDRKARVTRLCGLALVVGFVGVAALAAVLGIAGP